MAKTPDLYILSLDPTEKSERPNRWVMTIPGDEFAQVVYEKADLSISQIVDLTHQIAEHLLIDRVLVRSYGLGAAVAEALAHSYPESQRDYEIWTVYPGKRIEWDGAKEQAPNGDEVG